MRRLHASAGLLLGLSCATPSTLGLPCIEDEHCDSGQVCEDGVCANPDGSGTSSGSGQTDDGSDGDDGSGTTSSGGGTGTSTSDGDAGTGSGSTTDGGGITSSSTSSDTGTFTGITTSGGTTGTTSSGETTGTTSGTTATASGTTSSTTTGMACTNGVTVLSHQKVSDTEGGFTGVLDDSDAFGVGVVPLDDLDDDGVPDLMVSVHDDDGGNDRGGAWNLFLNANGAVKSHQKISDTQGDFAGTLEDGDLFGRGSASLGDFDKDGVTDVAVGAFLDDDGGNARGAVWILLLNDNGTVKSHQKISDTQGGFIGVLEDADEFGMELSALGDLDGDNVTDLAVGAYLDDDGGMDRGAVWILFLNADGTVESHQKISDTEGGFIGVLEDSDVFGISVATVGDVDDDGVIDIAVGASGDDDGGTDRGAVWMLFLNSDGTVKSHQKISETQGGFVGPLEESWQSFGVSTSELGDMDGNGVPDIAVGHSAMDEGGTDRGAIWLLFLSSDGTVGAQSKISDAVGGFGGTIDDGDAFGRSIAPVGDLDNNGVTDIAVGAEGDGDGGHDHGAVWILFLECA